MSRQRRPIPQGVAWLTVAGLIGAASSFLFWLIAARRTTIETVGHATVVVLVASVVNAVTSFGFTVGLLRAKAKSGLSQYTVVVASVMSLGGSLIASAMTSAVWADSSLQAAGMSRLLLFLYLGGLSGSLAVSTLIDTLAVGYDVAMLAVLRNGAVLVVRLLIVALVPDITVGGLVFVFLIPLLFSTVVSLPWLLSRATLQQTDRQQTFSALRESILAWPTSLIFSGLSLALPLVVALVVGPARGAVFYLLWNIALMSNSLVGAATSLGLGHGHSDVEADGLSRRSQGLLLVVSLMMSVGGVIAVYVFGSDYVRFGRNAAPLIGLGLIPYGYLQYHVLRLRRAGQHGRAAFATGAVLFVMITALTSYRPQSLAVVAFMWCGASLAGAVLSRPRREHKSAIA
jgi:hypothetical protein